MDVISLSKFAAALVFVLCLMGGLAFVLQWLDRKGGHFGFLKTAIPKKRLQVCERLTLDRQKTALILRIDDREYLVISGPSGDTVVESKKRDGSVVQINPSYLSDGLLYKNDRQLKRNSQQDAPITRAFRQLSR